jgi:hypothetical protein
MADLARQIKGVAPKTILQKQGFKDWEANDIMAVGRASQKDFDEAINRPSPPAPSHFKRYSTNDAEVRMISTFKALWAFTRRLDAKDIASAVPAEDTAHWRRIVEQLTEWLDDFDQHLKGE